MSEVGFLRVSLGLDSIDFTQGMRDVNRRLTALNSEFKAISTGAAKFDNSLDTSRNRADVLTRTLDTHSRKVNELRLRYEQSKATKGEDAAETVRLATAYNNAVAAMRRTEAQLQQVNNRIEEQSDTFKQLERTVNSSVDGISRQLRVLDSGFTAATAGTESLDSSVNQLRSRSEYLSQALNLQQDRIRELTRLHQASAAATGADSSATQEIQIRLNRATQQMRETEAQLRQTTSQIQQQSNAWNRLRQRVDNTGDRMHQFGGRMQATGSEITQTFGVAFLAVSAGLGVTAKKAMDFESQMSSVKSVMSPDEVNEFGEALEKLALKMGAETKYSATEAAQGIEELIKAGVSVTDIVKGGLDGALALAVAGELELADASEVASTALNAFKKDSLSVMEAADMLAGAANASATSVSEMKFGLSMVSAVASGVGLSFKDTTTALASFAQNGLKGSDAGTSLKTMLLNLSPKTKEATAQMKALGLDTANVGAAYNWLVEKGMKPTAKTADAVSASLRQLAKEEAGPKATVSKMAEEYEKLSKYSGFASSAFYDANGNLKSMAEIAGILQNALKNLNGEQRQQALNTMFGTDAIRAANILYKEGSTGINNMAIAMMKVKAADVAATKLDNVKGKIQLLKGTVETAAISFGNTLLPTIDRVVVNIQRLTERFNNLSPEMKETIAKAALVTAGITGLVTVVGGGLAILGAAVTGIGALTSAFALLSGPVGIIGVIAGVGALTVAGIQLNKITKESNEITFAQLEARQKEIQSNDELIKKYDELMKKNQLTNSEMLRFLDIQSLLESTASPERIAALKDEQAKLLEKSGLTNQEMEAFLKYNDKIIEKAPATKKAISSEGKAFAENTFELQKVNAEKLRGLKIDAEKAINNSLGKENELLKQQKELVNDIKENENEHQKSINNIIDLNTKITDQEKIVNELKKDRSLHGQELTRQAQEQLDYLNKAKEKEDTNLSLLLAQIQADQNSLDLNREKLKKLDEEKFKYESIVLAQVGLNVEKGKGLETLEKEIAKLQSAKDELKKLHSTGELNTAEYNDQVAAIDQQIGKLQGAKGELVNINDLAGKTIYKSVIIDEQAKKDAENLNALLSKKITKDVYINTPKGFGRNVQQYAKGTRSAPGGLAWVGEMGRELAYLPGMGMALVSGPSLLNLPQGARVIPNRDTERILQNWNIPKLAGGGTVINEGWAIAGERGREIVDFTGVTTNPYQSDNSSSAVAAKQPAIIQIVTPDKYEIARWLVEDITGIQEFNVNRKRTFEGR